MQEEWHKRRSGGNVRVYERRKRNRKCSNFENKNYKYSSIQRSVVERGKIVEKGRMSVNVCDCTFLRNVRRNIFLIGLTTRARVDGSVDRYYKIRDNKKGKLKNEFNYLLENNKRRCKCTLEISICRK